MKHLSSICSFKSIAAWMSVALLTTACTTSEATDPTDPWESVNRGTFEFNHAVDSVVIAPIAKGYRYVTPTPVRERIGHASDNLYEPVNMVNAFLQGDVTQGINSFWRFIINSTVGIGGLNDVATTAGIKERREDFGQTLATWGVGDGPYLILPIFGPSTLRDTAGKGVDWFALDPVNYALTDRNAQLAVGLSHGLVERERLIETIDDVYENALDPYVTLRSIYQQHRKAQIKNTKAVDPTPLDK